MILVFGYATVSGSSRSSDFVTGAVNRDFWACGSFAGAALGEPRSADFVAGAALGERRSVQISWQE